MTIVMSCGVSTPVFAQIAALAQCSMRGVPGSGIGSSESEAATNAVNNCVNRGGVPGCCHVIATTEQVGTPCIAFAQNLATRYVSVGGGDSKALAVADAINSCGEGCTPVAAVCE
jgi:hypothetical protein